MSKLKQDVIQFLNSLEVYTHIVFVGEDVGDCMYFNAINEDGVAVNIRADVEEDMPVSQWNIYDCDTEHEWEHILLIYPRLKNRL